MFTIECSKVMKKNTMIGIHMAITLPLTVVEIIAPTTPVETIQLQSMPRTNSVSMPAGAVRCVTEGAALADRADRLADRVRAAVVKPNVKTIAIITATVRRRRSCR